MGFDPSLLITVKDINPVNQKARSVPIFNPINQYGRVFFFSWFGFLVAFWSWYAFPPLLHDVIAKDLKLTPAQTANSNIIALVATFGPRWTFAGCLLVGAVPTFCAGGVTNASGLMAVRFFVGVLGGSFVPCQVWTTGFFDKNIVGTANAMTAGLGNSGGGITYFLMPAIYDSLVSKSHMTTHVAWRVSFVVPGIIIVVTAIALVALCPDTPTGKWSERQTAAQANLRRSSIGVVPIPGELSTIKSPEHATSGGHTPSHTSDGEKADFKEGFTGHEKTADDQQLVEVVQGEVIRKPTAREIAKVIFSASTFVTGACYFCSFGTELAVNSILGTYYQQNFPRLGLQDSGNWAAMFGLLNVVFRPLGGVVSDFVYGSTKSVWSKKAVLHTYGVITGAFLIAIGVLNSKNQSTMLGLVAGMAFFLEGGNGMNYSLVPHVHPYANGVVSGFTGACGNLGGIIFSIIFRYDTTQYGKSIWIIGVITIAVNLAVSWIRPIPKGQVGGK